MPARRQLLIPALALALTLPPSHFSAAEAPAAAAASAEPLLGFSSAGAKAERELEARFDAALQAADLRAWMQRITSHPHHVGSPWDKANAEFMADLFRSWGYQTRIESFKVLFPTPKTRLLEMEAPVHFKASLTEPPIAGDATSQQTAEQLPLYNAYSIDGDVTGELVYVNYGVPKDYEELARRGIDVKGKIVISRYGGSWRGIKPKVAGEHGAIGCIIYSDPRDDGYFRGDVYPKGGYRNENSGQRGSVADMPLYSGDPLTPGRRRHRGRQAAGDPGRADDHQNPRPADLLRRRPAAPQGARRPDRPRGVARRAPHPLPSRRRPGPRPSQAGVQLGSETALRRHRPPPRRRAAGRVGDPRQPPRRLGGRRLGPGERPGRRARGGARRGRAREERLEAAAHPDLRRLGRRGAGAPRLDRMGRDPCRRAARPRGRLHQFGRQLARLLQRRRLAHPRDLRQSGGARRDRSREGGERPRPLRSPTCSSPARPNGSRRRRPARRSASSRWARAPTTPPSSSTWGSRRSTSATAARGSTASTTPPTTRSITSSASPIRSSSTASPWRRPPAVSTSAWPTPTCCR